MTSENLTAGPYANPSEPGHDSTPSVSPELLRRVRGSPRDRTPEDVMSAISDGLVDDDEVAVSEELVTQSLDEILLALIVLRDDETHGTGLMEDVAQLFDVRPSPGTVYPRLHDLDADGTLSRHDLVQTKQYSVADDDVVAERIESAMYQHLAIGLFLQAALDAV
ncbi:PadR family transcriptional regulator [Halobacteriales archaeon Cl-PHB]